MPCNFTATLLVSDFNMWSRFVLVFLPRSKHLLISWLTEETRIERDTCTPMFIAALFIIARTWKQPRCPSADEWIRDAWYIYTMEYYSAIKKKYIWISSNEVDETGAYYTEWSQPERKTPIQYQIRSDQISCSVVSDSLRPHESQHARPPCPSRTPGVHSDSCPSSQWCHPAISSSVVPFSSWPQSLDCICKGLFVDSILFHWSVCLYLCWYHTILITIVV